ncbi:O-antigen ligase family protein [uncultured Pontibacter sp.]|uniref:O-antigen ligase family protein n=1 Tax=uncultured Pontibacter sp. TaxID=453356 RepID=UPI0026179FA3|nr:O-antigen ligase family protein [uncultured Pontibacter sp.]
MKFNYSVFFTAPLVLIMLMDAMFLELLSPKNEVTQGIILAMMVKLTAVISMGYCVYNIRYMSSYMRFAFILTLLFVVGMVFESFLKYNTPLIYPHVFLKVFLFFYTFFIYTYYRKNEYLNLEHVIWFILIGFSLNVAIVNRESLSIAAFTSHDRGVYATSVYMIVIPFLYFMSKYLFKGGLFNMAMAFLVLFLIVFFQHRTVWITTAGILIVYVLLVKFKSATEVNFKKLIPLGVTVFILGIISSAFVFSMNPEIVEKFQENFSDIENMDSQGTGGWRYQQFMSYWPFVVENPIWGMRFEGFELPIQFYRDDINAPVFEDGNGHFFHSFYMDVLFYIGTVGMLLFWLVKFYAIHRGFKLKHLTQEQIVLLSFITSGFVFGISYILPYFFYAILGLTIAYLDSPAEENVSYLVDFAKRRKERIRKLHHQVNNVPELITTS